MVNLNYLRGMKMRFFHLSIIRPSLLSITISMQVAATQKWYAIVIKNLYGRGLYIGDESQLSANEGFDLLIESIAFV
jgi:hypothetical protein